MRTKHLYSIAAVALMAAWFGMGLVSCAEKEDEGLKFKITSPSNGVVNVAVGESADVELSITPDDKYRQMEYISGNPDVFWVNSLTGRIWGVSEGNGTLAIKERSTGTTRATCKVNVTAGVPTVLTNMSWLYNANTSPLLPTNVSPDGQVTFDMAAYVANNVLLSPYWASNKVLTYELTSGNGTVATIDANTGIITGVAAGTFAGRFSTTDGSGKNLTFTGWCDPRAKWKITTSSPTQVGDAVSGWPGWLVNVRTNTGNGQCMGLPKVGEPGQDKMWFTIDFGEELTFNSFEITHRSGSFSHLAVYDAQLLESTDGNTWTPITDVVDVYDGLENNSTTNRSTAPTRCIRSLDQTHTTRYLKFIYKRWWGENGDYLQTNDFNVGMNIS